VLPSTSVNRKVTTPWGSSGTIGEATDARSYLSPSATTFDCTTDPRAGARPGCAPGAKNGTPSTQARDVPPLDAYTHPVVPTGRRANVFHPRLSLRAVCRLRDLRRAGCGARQVVE
jgi:hypothetical protein